MHVSQFNETGEEVHRKISMKRTDAWLIYIVNEHKRLKTEKDMCVAFVRGRDDVNVGLSKNQNVAE